MMQTQTRAEDKEEPATRVTKVEVEKSKTAPKKTLFVLSVKSPFACRHLLNDLESLMPQWALRDSKMKNNFSMKEVAEMADLKDADNVFMIETRTKTPAPILWAFTRDVNPETQEEKCEVIKFMMTGVYTMKEMKFMGNPLANTQMATLFSKSFEKSKGMRKAKAILNRIFNTTSEKEGEPSAISDHTDKIASFFLIEEQIMVRFYHIARKTQETEKIEAEKRRKEYEREREKKAENKESGSEDENEEKTAEKKNEHQEDVKKGVEDPNIPQDLSQMSWLEITEIGPRFTLHPRESDLDDRYLENVEESRAPSTENR